MGADRGECAGASAGTATAVATDTATGMVQYFLKLSAKLTVLHWYSLVCR